MRTRLARRGVCCPWSPKLGRWPRRQSGLSLLELLITLTIGAAILGFGLPAMGRAMAQNQLAVSHNQLLTAAVAARQSAISRNVSMTFCAGRTEVGCHGDWSRQEWLVFEDADHDGNLDSGEAVKLADLLSPSGRLSIAGNGPFRRAVVFKPSGAAQTVTGAFAAGRLRICVSEPIPDNAVDLVLIGSGRIEPEHHDFAGTCPEP